MGIMLQFIPVVLLSFFISSHARAENFQLLGSGSPSECESSSSPTRYVRCTSETLLANTDDPGNIYRCFSHIWIQYDDKTAKIDSGGKSTCYLEKLTNYPTNPVKSNYSFLHDRLKQEPAKLPDGVDYEIFLIAKNEIFSFTACMGLEVDFPSPRPLPVRHDDCIGAQKPVVAATPEEVRRQRKQMMQDLFKTSR